MDERNVHVPLEQIREYVEKQTYPDGYKGKFCLIFYICFCYHSEGSRLTER